MYEKINKIPEFYMASARKIFFQIFFFGGVANAPVSYVYCTFLCTSRMLLQIRMPMW